MARVGSWSSASASRANVGDILHDLDVDVRAGLSSSRVALSLSAFGRNELPEAEEEPLWKKFLAKLKEPMIALLLTSAGVSLLTGQYDDAVSIALVRRPLLHLPLALHFFFCATFSGTLHGNPPPPPPPLCRRRCSSWSL